MSDVPEESTPLRNESAAEVIAAYIAEALASYETERDDLLQRIVWLRTNRLHESIRRSMEGLRLKSTYNKHAVRTLAAQVTRLRDELQSLVMMVATKRTLLEFAELELEEYKAADQRNIEDRRVKAEAGLYAEPAMFADKLFSDHGIDRGGYAALEASDLAAIAAIIKFRVAEVNREYINLLKSKNRG